MKLIRNYKEKKLIRAENVDRLSYGEVLEREQHFSCFEQANLSFICKIARYGG